jgi:hypothetical protein
VDCYVFAVGFGIGVVIGKENLMRVYVCVCVCVVVCVRDNVVCFDCVTEDGDIPDFIIFVCVFMIIFF